LIFGTRGEALRIRVVWANETLRRCPNSKIKRLRDVYAMNLRRVSLEIESLEARGNR
jgi:hypothetical protein